ncbi:MAG TPA: thioredoxin domain-containing protein [Gemmatimonadales bacterium]|nr:thioredoxin domain-containing protein [Gemmatimonadales bacterium]
MSGWWSEERASRAILVVTIGFIVATLGVILSPNGLVGRPWHAWRAEVQRSVLLQESWAELSGTKNEFVSGRGDVPADAPALVVFSDYRCTYCRALFNRLDSTGEANHLRLLVQPFPVDSLSGRAAAEVAVCASREGVFPRVNAALMRREDWFVMTHSAEIARLVLGDSVGDVLACLESDYPGAILASADSLRRRLGVVVTPTVVGPASVVPGLPPVGFLDSLAAVVNTVERMHIGPIVFSY